jgi:hypothetical protein
VKIILLGVIKILLCNKTNGAGFVYSLGSPLYIELEIEIGEVRLYRILGYE